MIDHAAFQALENPGEIFRSGPAGDFGPTSGPRRKERTTYDDFYGADFWMFQAKSMDYGEKGGRK